MPVSESDPRVFFASERTFLAWLRTGITMIALGFVIARFGLFVEILIAPAIRNDFTEQTKFSAVFGVAFVIVGTLSILLASIQHKKFIASLPKDDLPKSYSNNFTHLISIFMSVMGSVLAIYLLLY